MKTSELTGAALDWAVAKCKNLNIVFDPMGFGDGPNGGFWVWDETDRQKAIRQKIGRTYSPSTDWAQGGLILTNARISRTIDHSGQWIAYWTDGYTEGDEGKLHMQCDRSELVAGLRCYVAMKLGDEVEIPEELK